MIYSAISNEGDRFNPGVFDATIPTAAHVNRADTGRQAGGGVTQSRKGLLGIWAMELVRL
jgi:hypothetical protein